MYNMLYVHVNIHENRGIMHISLHKILVLSDVSVKVDLKQS